MSDRDARPASTRSRIIDAATALFLMRGYDRTSVDAILERAGLSKGTFYHHFGSKSAILDAVVEQLADEAYEVAREAIDGEGTALERFNRMVRATRSQRLEAIPQSAELTRSIYQPENTHLRERIRRVRLTRAKPLISEVIRDGCTEGSFDAPDPDEAARLFLVLTQAVTEDITIQILTADPAKPPSQLKRSILTRLEAMQRAVEAIFGIQPGATPPPDPAVTDALVETLWQHQQPHL